MADLRSAPAPPARPDDHARGGDGPLVIVYADFTCPRCAVAHERLAALPVRRVFRHLALKARHPRAVPLARAAEAAALQDAFWPFHDALYADQGRQDDPHLWALAERLGLDVERLERDRRSDAVAARVEAQTREALRAGAMHTPTIFLADGERIDPHELDTLTAGHHELRPSPPDDVLTPAQAAGLLQLDEAAVLALADAGDLPGRRIGGEWRFAREALLAWLGGPETA
jgi:excisionase family DNA binding protein